MNSYFAKTTRWRIAETAIADSFFEMALDGRLGNEGIVLWLGRDQDGRAEVTHLVKLRGPLIYKCPNQIRIDPALFNEVADVAIERKVRLLGQIHSHGSAHGLDLSFSDRSYGVKAPYYLSLVAPNYARSVVPVSACGVHVFRPTRRYLFWPGPPAYVRLTPSEVSRSLQIVLGPSLPFITVGGQL